MSVKLTRDINGITGSVGDTYTLKMENLNKHQVYEILYEYVATHPGITVSNMADFFGTTRIFMVNAIVDMEHYGFLLSEDDQHRLYSQFKIKVKGSQ